MKKTDLTTSLPFFGVALFFLAISGPPIAWSADQAVVVTFGDSTTATRGELKIYSQVLSDEIRGIKVINAGIGGNNTNHAKARFAEDVRNQSPDIVVIQFGINDAAIDVWKDPPAKESRISLADYETNLRLFIDTLARDRTSVILMTPNPLRWNDRMREMYGKPPYNPKDEDGFNFRLKLYADKVRKLAEEKKLPLVDVYQLFEEHGAKPGKSVDELLLDGVHPNEAGQQIVADGLIPLIQKLIEKTEAGGANSLKLKIAVNPVASRLSGSEEGMTMLRFEDYVSNPQPGEKQAQQGWVAKYSVPFTGLINPAVANTNAASLPNPLGILIESPSGEVGFYDPASQVDCADARADKLIFRFVDPADSRRAATVSQVVFRVTGTSVINEKVRYSFYDISGKKLGSGTAEVNSTRSGAEGEIDATAFRGGKPSSAIHKLVIEHSGSGYFVVGGVARTHQPDIGFSGFQVSDQIVNRSTDEQIPRSHQEQWQQFRKAERITDMTEFGPAEALSLKREHNKWKVFEYETAEFSGKCLSVGIESSAPDLTLKLDQKGWHAVYLGISTITDLVRPAPNQLEAKFTGDSSYRRLSNRLDLVQPRRRDTIEEVFLGATNLSVNDLQISTVYEMPARLHFVKTIKLTEKEVATLISDRTQKTTRTAVATMDGYSWIHPFRPQGRADLAATFSRYLDSDFKTWWFQVGGADLVNYPSEVGNAMGASLNAFPRSVDREFSESLRHLHQQGIDPLKVAVEEAHAQDAEILVCLRAAGWKAAPPWEEFFMSNFYEAHPEWRCVDYDGTPVMHMSYAVEEVQDHLIEIYREVLKRGADGAGFLFHRGLPLMLWEEPFCKRFMEKFEVDPRKIDEDDPRIAAMRAEIVTGFMRKIRAVLDEEAIKRGEPDRRLKLAVSTFAAPEDNRKFGLDVEAWIEEGLIDQIGVAWFAYYTSGQKTRSGDNAYYEKITKGTDVKFFPFYIGWKMKSAPDILTSITRDYQEGADGIAVWDPEQFRGWQEGKHSYWPLLSRVGHREQIADGSLLFDPVSIPLTRMGENYYSRWYPNTGF